MAEQSNQNQPDLNQSSQNQSEQVAAMIARLSAAQSPAEQAAVVAEIAFGQMPESKALVARRCAILRWFNEDVVAALLPDDSALTAEKALTTLSDLPFVERTTHGWRYHDQTREGLLQTLSPALLRESATIAASAFQKLENTEASLERLYCLVASGAQEQAIALLDDLLLAHGRYQDWQGLSIVLQTAEEAEKLHFVNALTRSALHYVASGLARRAKGELEQAIGDYDKAIELNPKFAIAYSNRGLARRAKGELEQAIGDYDKAIELNPEDAIAYIGRGLARYDKGELEQAIGDYDKAIELNPEDAIAYSNRGLARTNKGELEQAIGDYDKAIELNPKYADAYSNRGNALSQLEKWSEAKSSYQTVIRLDPNSYLARISLANIARREGNQTVWQDLIDQARPLVDYSDRYNAACFESIAGNVEKALDLLAEAIAKAGRYRALARQDPDFEWIWDDPRFWEIVGE